MSYIEKLCMIASYKVYLDKCKTIAQIDKCVKEVDYNACITFDPWIYVAGYPQLKKSLWDKKKDTLNETQACYHYIIYGSKNGFLLNKLGYVCTREIAIKYLCNRLLIGIVGNGYVSEKHKEHVNKFDIVVRCNEAPCYEKGDKIDYLIYRKYTFTFPTKYERFKNIYKNATTLLELKSDKPYNVKCMENQNLHVIDYTKYNIKHKGVPSTGFIAYYVMKDYYPESNIELFGFGFKGAKVHHMESERQYFIENGVIIN